MTMTCHLKLTLPSATANHNFSPQSCPFRFAHSRFTSNSFPFLTRNSESLVANCRRKYWHPKVLSSPDIDAVEEGVSLNIVISGAPASGKGTQCQFIAEKYGAVHIAAGDLLREEIAAETEKGKVAKRHMELGELVPDEVVVMMVKDRLLEAESTQNGWLLDGYPRSLSQALALENLGFRPDIFILLEVPEEILIRRVIGRRLDPLTGRIYHVRHFPPETEEIASRLIQRFDDTEEMVKLRLVTHRQNVDAVLSVYEDITLKVSGAQKKEGVFEEIDGALEELLLARRKRRALHL